MSNNKVSFLILPLLRKFKDVLDMRIFFSIVSLSVMVVVVKKKNVGETLFNLRKFSKFEK